MFIISISADLIFLIATFGILQAILLAALLYFHPRSDRSVSIFLVLYILCVSSLMLIPVVQQFISWQSILYLMPFPLLIGPFLYLYVRSFKEVITWRKTWPHFLLFFIFLFLDYIFLPELASKYPPSNQVPKEVLLNPSSYIRIIIRNVQMVIYYFFSLRALTSYQKSIKHLFSETSRINLNWVRWLINGYLFIILSLMILFYLVFQYPDQFKLLILVNTAIITPYIYLISYKGITQPTLWQIQANKKKENLEHDIYEAEEIESLKKDEKKNQSLKGQADNKTEEIISRIMESMNRVKIYQEPELTLQTLAQSLGFPSYQVSQAINEGMQKNFYDLINGYRVEEAKRLLLDSKNRNYTILSVGFEAGFNSKTTFNTVFKKFTGLTPTEFRDKQMKPSVPA